MKHDITRHYTTEECEVIAVLDRLHGVHSIPRSNRIFYAIAYTAGGLFTPPLIAILICTIFKLEQRFWLYFFSGPLLLLLLVYAVDTLFSTLTITEDSVLRHSPIPWFNWVLMHKEIARLELQTSKAGYRFIAYLDNGKKRIMEPIASYDAITDLFEDPSGKSFSVGSQVRKKESS
jgi:hypothetical protein